jgi:oligopeptide/dipeptide ABC transporter ATP-binding protein
MNFSLEVQDLHVAYASRTGQNCRALTGVNLEVRSKEIVGIVGESGSGKSTLAASLLRLLPPNALFRKGRILLNGGDLLEMNPRELREIRGKHISIIHQEPSLALHPTMRISDQVSEVLFAHGMAEKRARRERVQEILHRIFPVDAQRIASSYPHQLSGGQRQRALIAQAIACQPPLLVADEPTASLDPSTQHEILALFRRLRDELGVAIVFITHNPALLLGFADRVLVLYGGTVVESGPTEEVLFASQHPYTRALLRCVTAFDGEERPQNKQVLPVIPGIPPNLGMSLQGCVFEPRCVDRMGLCQSREPATVAVNDRHQAACLKLGE